MKTLKFKPHLCELILSGEKTTTWRLFDDKNLQINDVFEIINKETLEVLKIAKIIKLKEVKFKDLSDDDWEGHEKFDSNEEMYKAYNTYYSQDIDENTLIKIIKFELLE